MLLKSACIRLFAFRINVFHHGRVTLNPILGTLFDLSAADDDGREGGVRISQKRSVLYR